MGKWIYLLPYGVVVLVPLVPEVPTDVGHGVVGPSSYSITTDGAPELGLSISDGPVEESTSSVLYVLSDASCEIKHLSLDNAASHKQTKQPE